MQYPEASRFLDVVSFVQHNRGFYEDGRHFFLTFSDTAQETIVVFHEVLTTWFLNSYAPAWFENASEETVRDILASIGAPVDPYSATAAYCRMLFPVYGNSRMMRVKYATQLWTVPLTTLRNMLALHRAISGPVADAIVLNDPVLLAKNAIRTRRVKRVPHAGRGGALVWGQPADLHELRSTYERGNDAFFAAI